MSQNPVIDRTKELEDAFVKVTFEDESSAANAVQSDDPFHDPWVEQGI